MLASALTLALALAATAHDGDADDRVYRSVDYAELKREIAKQPTYVAEPLYGLFLFGPAGDVPMWAVLDKSDAQLAYYDVLYLDLDADGDLTDPGERLVGKYDENMARAGMAVAIRLEELPVPGTEIVHTKFLVSTVRKTGRKGIWFRMQWRGEEQVSGGYGPSGSDTTIWTGSPATAPVLRPTAMGPLSFALWGEKDVKLTIGGEAHLNVIVGNRGFGPDTLAVLDEDFLDLEQDALYVTVIARDWDDEEVRERSRIQSHC